MSCSLQQYHLSKSISIRYEHIQEGRECHTKSTKQSERSPAIKPGGIHKCLPFQCPKLPAATTDTAKEEESYNTIPDNAAHTAADSVEERMSNSQRVIRDISYVVASSFIILNTVLVAKEERVCACRVLVETTA